MVSTSTMCCVLRTRMPMPSQRLQPHWLYRLKAINTYSTFAVTCIIRGLHLDQWGLQKLPYPWGPYYLDVPPVGRQFAEHLDIGWTLRQTRWIVNVYMSSISIERDGSKVKIGDIKKFFPPQLLTRVLLERDFLGET